MTNEEAIKIIKMAISEVEWEYSIDYAAALEVAIKALEEQSEMPEVFNAVIGILQKLSISNAYHMPGFWYNNSKDYKVIPTKYHKGYMQALKDVEREIRLQFGLTESDIHTVGSEPYEKECSE